MKSTASATETMYKYRFDKWGITKNERNAPSKRGDRRQRREIKTSRGSSSSSMSNDVGVSRKDLFENMCTLCVEGIQQKQANIWALEDEFRVFDDDWEDAYGSAAALILELANNPDSPSGWDTLREDIAPMVKTLNYFSFPTILIIAFKMSNKLVDPKVRHTMGDFLSGCLGIARAESVTSSRHVALANLLEGLNHAAEQHDNIESLVKVIISCYIHLANNCDTSVKSGGATALSLLSFYHVQLGFDEPWLEGTLDKIMKLLKRAEADRGEDDKATIEIMGLAIMVLQKTKQEKTLQHMCAQMRLRINRQLDNLPRDDPDHRYFLDRLLDAHHLEFRLAQEDGADELAAALKNEYARLEAKHEKEKDGYGKVLDLEVKELTSKLDRTSMCERGPTDVGTQG
ncbi:hypothetical protein MFIFM68171_06129 [Madurella fahalii]|uniref:Interferon-related developmental regulator N-terminal domain-containing protein n=1 Tax=Madurella fahalii TaxID=1157608 RepID=A0ABQ0GDV1_9PEZI